MKDINKLIENYEFDAKDIAGAKPYMKVVSSDRVRKIFQQAMKEAKEKAFEKGYAEGYENASNEAAEEIHRNYTPIT